MDPTRRRSDRFSHVLKKSDDIVVRPLLYLQNFWNRKSRPLPNFRCVILWDLAKLGHRLAGEHFNLQPDLEFALVRPDLAHFWPGITVNHYIKIKAASVGEKCFVFANRSRILAKSAAACAVLSASSADAESPKRQRKLQHARALHFVNTVLQCVAGREARSHSLQLFSRTSSE